VRRGRMRERRGGCLSVSKGKHRKGDPAPFSHYRKRGSLIPLRKKRKGKGGGGAVHSATFLERRKTKEVGKEKEKRCRKFFFLKKEQKEEKKGGGGTQLPYFLWEDQWRYCWKKDAQFP